MEQRRKKVEQWRAEQAKKKQEQEEAVINQEAEEAADEKNAGEVKKNWTLEDENDDDEDNGSYNPMEEDIDDSALKLPEKKEENDDLIGKIPLIKKEADKEVEKKPIPAILKQPAVSKLKALIKHESKKELQKPVIKIIKKPVIPKEVKKEEPPPKEVDEEIDPLDAFMRDLNEKNKIKVVKKEDKKYAVVMGVAKKTAKKEPKGELLEQDQDAMEYSSEDEGTLADDLAAMNTQLQAKQAKKKVAITALDITYPPCTKDFYIEVPELAKMTPAEVESYREELGGIKVKGKGCPKPIKTWAQCGVMRKVLNILKKYNYNEPMPIQCQAIPAIMSGKDVIGIAETGSGKTLAFLIPLIRHISVNDHLDANDGPIGLIMTPTRELAKQICSVCEKFTKSLGWRTVCVYGGSPISEQIGQLKSGAEIVVCTPGRMIEILAANGGRVTNLRQTTYVVLDEADRMFDMGFEPQVMRIFDNMRPNRQIVMFSATFPRIMEALARRILKKSEVVEIQVGGRSIVCKDVEQHVVLIDEENKFLKLLQLLGENLEGERSAIVFVHTQESADSLLKELMYAGYTCLALHAGIDQQDRESTISDFKNNRVKVLIATSVAARGLDVKHCFLVVNYDCPNHYEDYVHRCGRTGRAGSKGVSWTFITRDEAHYVGDVINALKLSDTQVPEELELLYNDFKKRMELEGKKVKGSSGFSGKGFKFDESEAQLANEKKKFQKAALGIEDSDDEEVEGEIDQEGIENILTSKKGVKTSTQVISTTATTNSSSSTITSMPTANSLNIPLNASEKLELARRKASQIKIGTKASSTTEAFLKGESLNLNVSNALSAKSIAEQRAERIHAKLNYLPRDTDNDDVDPFSRREDKGEHVAQDVLQRFEEKIEINDYSQQARWRVTSKDTLAQISENSEAGITVRGKHVPANGQLPVGETKLHLAIEATSQLAVNKAKAEIMRLIYEEEMKVSRQASTRFNRYRVV